MRKIVFAICLMISIVSCNQKNSAGNEVASDSSFNKMLDNYYEQRMKL